MGSIWSKEPAIIIGAVVTVLLNVVASLTDQGFVSEVVSGRASDILNTAGAFIVSILPLVTAYFIRGKVSPAS